MSPKVSINLCCYNSEKYLEETLQSIFTQTFTDWELVIVNDGSTDSTEEIIKRYSRNGRRIVYRYQPNAGLGNARNKATQLSSGEYLAFIDHDDLWMPEKLEAQIKLFEQNPTLGLVYCDGYTIDSLGNLIIQYSSKHPLARGNIFNQLVRNSFIPPASAVIKRSVFNEVGPFPAFQTAEEYDLFLKITYQYPADFVAAPLFKYRSHEDNFSRRGTRGCLHRETIAIRKYWKDQIPASDIARARTMKKLLALGFASYGTWLLEEGRTDEARQNLVNSLKLYPFQFRYLHYALTWFPRSLANQVLAWLRRVKTCFA